MTIPPFVEGTASENNFGEDYASEDYSNWTEVAADLVDLMHHDAVPDELIDVDEPAHAAPTLVARNAIEQFAGVEAVEGDTNLVPELVAEEEDTLSEWYEAWSEEEDEWSDEEGEWRLRRDRRDEEGEWRLRRDRRDEEDEWDEEEEDEDVNLILEYYIIFLRKDDDVNPIIKYSKENWVEAADEEMFIQGCEEAAPWLAGGARVAGEVGLANSAIPSRIQDSPPPSPPFEAARAFFDPVTTPFASTAINYAPSPAHVPFTGEFWLVGEPEDLAELYAPFEVGAGAAIEEFAEEEDAMEATVTTVITNPASNVVDESADPNAVVDDSTVIEATGDSTVPTDDTEAFPVSSPIDDMLQELMLQEPHCSLYGRREFPH